jgi:Rap1a immunity proteins
MRLQGGRVRRHEAAQEEANEPDLHRDCWLAALIALSASAATADENPYSANSMLPAYMAVLAISSSNPACIGMIEGVALLANYGVFCPPAGAIIKQRIQVIIAYIEARPQRMHEDFRVLAVEAMQKAWPCKN